MLRSINQVRKGKQQEKELMMLNGPIQGKEKKRLKFKKIGQIRLTQRILEMKLDVY